MKEKVARLMAGTIKFFPDGKNKELVLGFNQSVSIARSAEKKELLSNDELIGEVAAETETKVSYEFSTEIGDLNAKALALAFKGIIEEKTYKAGDTFWNGKVIKEKTAAGEIGDVVIDGDKLYTVTRNYTSSPKPENFAPKVYKTKITKVCPERRTHNTGRMIIDGINLNTGNPCILIVPKINLGFEGDFTLIADDYAKLALKGKIIKTDSEDIFTLIDGELAQ